MKDLIKRARDLGFEVHIPQHSRRPCGITYFEFYRPGAEHDSDEYFAQLKKLANDPEILKHRRRLGCKVNLKFNSVGVCLTGLQTLPREWEEDAEYAVKLAANEVTQEDAYITADDCLNRIDALLERIAQANLAKPRKLIAVDAETMSHLISARSALLAATTITAQCA